MNGFNPEHIEHQSGNEKFPQFLYDERRVKSYISNTVLKLFPENQHLVVAWAIQAFVKEYYLQNSGKLKESFIKDLQNRWSESDYPEYERTAIEQAVYVFSDLIEHF